MDFELASLLLALIAGVLSVLSPCVWPLVPIIMASAAGKGRWGPMCLAFGLSLSFALSGGVLTYLLLNVGIDPGLLRQIAALMLVLVGLVLACPPLADWVSIRMSALSSRIRIVPGEANTEFGQFGVGLLLGFVWLPCVGPTLGAAIALASMGQSLGASSLVLFAYGSGTALALVTAAKVSQSLLSRWRPKFFSHTAKVKMILGILLIFMGIMVLTGIDKILETFAIQYLPDWTFAL